VSSIVATVSNIKGYKSLHIVEFESSGQTLSMISLDLSDKIEVGRRVKLVVKSSHIVIAKEFSGDISYINQLQTTIESIEPGELLSSIKLKCCDTTIESIITLKSLKRMNLRVGDRVTAFIKASELSIGEVIDD